MEIWERVKNSIPLPAVSFVCSMLLLLIAKRGKPVVALAACGLPPIALWLFTPDFAFAFHAGFVPAGILVVGLLMWLSPSRPASAAKALARSAVCGLLPCAASFYAYIATDCIHTSNGGCDEPLFWWAAAVASSSPLGVVVAASISRGPNRSLPWER